MVSISMYEWVIMLVLIFGGAGFVAKVRRYPVSSKLKDHLYEVVDQFA